MLRHHVEVRGLGILNIKDLFGVTAIRERKRIDIVVQLDEWDETREYDRLGVDDQHFIDPRHADPHSSPFRSARAATWARCSRWPRATSSSAARASTARASSSRASRRTPARSRGRDRATSPRASSRRRGRRRCTASRRRRTAASRAPIRRGRRLDDRPCRPATPASVAIRPLRATRARRGSPPCGPREANDGRRMSARHAARRRCAPAKRASRWSSSSPGLSGAGRTTALHALEDLGFFCIDNLPTALAPDAVALCEKGGITRVALGMDVRVRVFLGEVGRVLSTARGRRPTRSSRALPRRLRRDDPPPLQRDAPPACARACRAPLRQRRVACSKASRSSASASPRSARAPRASSTRRCLSVHDLRRAILAHFGPASGHAPSG